MKVLSRLRKDFDKVAKSYLQSSVMQQEIASRLLGRLDYLKITPKVILDIGCGTAATTAALKKCFPKALVIGIDCSLEMLKQGNNKRYFWNKLPFIQADAMQLPVAGQSVDLIFSNQMLQWLPETNGFFEECFRVLKPEGCLLFSSLGPDTFKEFRQAFASLDNAEHVNTFTDLHDIGDALMQHDFLDPVMDREDLQLNYSSNASLLKALRAQGIRNYSPNRAKGLTTPRKLQAMWQAYPRHGEKFPVSYEIIYGHAWRAEFAKHTGEQVISIEKLRSSLPSSKKQ